MAESQDSAEGVRISLEQTRAKSKQQDEKAESSSDEEAQMQGDEEPGAASMFLPPQASTVLTQLPKDAKAALDIAFATTSQAVGKESQNTAKDANPRASSLQGTASSPSRKPSIPTRESGTDSGRSTPVSPRAPSAASPTPDPRERRRYSSRLDKDEKPGSTSSTASASASMTAAAGLQTPAKVTVHFQPIGSAPLLKHQKLKVNASWPFSTVVAFLRRKLGLTPPKAEEGAAAAPAKNDEVSGAPLRKGEGLFVYISNVFAPAGDEDIGGLWRCFRNTTTDELVVNYSRLPAFG